MRVGFDVTPLCMPRSGIGTYTVNLLDYLGRQGHDEIVPLANFPTPAPTIPWDGYPFEARSSRRLQLNKTLWMQAVLPWQLTRLGADVCHFTNSVAPWRTPCPSVLTIHDTTLWLFPQHHPRRRLLAMRPLIPLAARRASAVIAVSESAKRDIVHILKVPAHRVHVIYEAAAACFRPIEPGDALDGLRQQYGLPERFVLHVGTLEPRKNLVRLLEAFAQWRRCGNRSHALVLVGGRGWKDAAVFESVERLGLGGLVCILGYVPTPALVGIYNLAEAVVFPSLYEGFGLPVVEAMACGTPVITSRNGSLGEVAGTAAEFVDATSVDSIVGGLRNVLSDADRQAELRLQGPARAATFSWTAAALETRRLYAQVAGHQDI